MASFISRQIGSSGADATLPKLSPVKSHGQTSPRASMNRCCVPAPQPKSSGLSIWLKAQTFGKGPERFVRTWKSRKARTSSAVNSTSPGSRARRPQGMGSTMRNSCTPQDPASRCSLGSAFPRSSARVPTAPTIV